MHHLPPTSSGAAFFSSFREHRVSPSPVPSVPHAEISPSGSGICMTIAIANRAPSDLESDSASATPSTLTVTFSNVFPSSSHPTVSVEPTTIPPSGGSTPQIVNKHGQKLVYPTILEVLLGVLFVAFCIGLGTHLRKRWRRRRALGAPGGSAALIQSPPVPSGGPTRTPAMSEVPVTFPVPTPGAATTSRNDEQRVDEAILEVPR